MARSRCHPLRILASLGLLFGACVPRTAVLPPPLEGTDAFIFVFASGDRFDLFAANVEEGRVAVPAFAYGGDGMRVFALAYPCSLAALDLDPGWQALRRGAAGRPLPEGASALELRGLGDLRAPEQLRWEPIVDVPAEIAALTLDRTRIDRCAEFESTPVALPASDGMEPSFVLSLGADRVLVGATNIDRREALFWTVTPQGAARLELPKTLPSLAGFRAGDGTIWLTGSFGRSARGDLVRGFSETATMAAPYARVGAWLDGTRDDAPFELFAVTDKQTFERFDGESWELLSGPGCNPLSPASCSPGAVVRLGRSEAIAVIPGIRDVVKYYKDGEIRDDDFTTFGSDIATAAVLVPSLGVVLGSTFGSLFLRERMSWEQLDYFQGTEVRRLIALDESVLVNGNASITEFHPTEGVCGSLGIGLVYSSAELAPRSRAVLARYINDRTITVVFLSWIRRSNACPG